MCFAHAENELDRIEILFLRVVVSLPVADGSVGNAVLTMAVVARLTAVTLEGLVAIEFAGAGQLANSLESTAPRWLTRCRTNIYKDTRM